MHERAFEIIVSRNVPRIFGNRFRLIAQQLSIPGGRVDLLISNGCEQFIVELKKGQATGRAIDQIVGYVSHFQSIGAEYHGWVVAHQIPESVEKYAEHMRIRTTALPLDQCLILQRQAHLDAKALLGVRVESGVIKGGGATRTGKQQVPFTEALSEMAPGIRDFFNEIRKLRGIEIVSGKLQSMIIYKGMKIGGLRRLNPVFYISSGLVVSDEDECFLLDNGFSKRTKWQRSSNHEHLWFDIPATNVQAFSVALDRFTTRIDNLLGIKKANAD